jgi:putative nucleotidyltransferase with HDIG domain
VDAKDHSTLAHSERVADLAGRLASRMGWAGERIALLREAALVHDVGKIGVSDSILFKDGGLSEAEYGQVKRHAALGADIASEVLSAEQVGWVRSHHERWDGTGYPDGLAGAAIPEGAQVLAVADAFDVMTGSRHYSAPITPEEAVEECRLHAGRQFAPRVVEALEAVCHAAGHRPPPRSGAGLDAGMLTPNRAPQRAAGAAGEARR